MYHSADQAASLVTVYKQIINKPNSLNPSSFTNTKDTQLQYSPESNKVFAYLIIP